VIDWDRLEEEIADAGRGERIADQVVHDGRRRRRRRSALFGACAAVVAAGIAGPPLTSPFRRTSGVRSRTCSVSRCASSRDRVVTVKEGERNE
jgi:hypothetical protein